MVSLLKNQILKHLSRYTKNLSPDKVNVSTFKGEGELTSLELDENVLTDLLELPSWVRLTSALCNKLSFRIQWTKLDTIPIFFSLDEIKIEMETCEELRSPSSQQTLASYGNATKYSFMHRVLDGITISINVVHIKFKTPAFIASVQVMRILVESKSPNWKSVDLKKTWLKDEKKETVLIFKSLEWNTLRLEATSTKDSGLPPLRLLTNKTKCRLTIKKRLSDRFVLGCKLLLILEDLLWVLTDSQLKAVLHFVESLSDLVQRANEITRTKKAARKLEILPEYHVNALKQARTTEPNPKEQLFESCDVVETSYHFIARKIDLHLSDDPGAGRSIHPLLNNGSNVHLRVTYLQVDYYPYHLASADRSRWPRYNHASSPHVLWLNTAQNLFKNSLLTLLDSPISKNTPTNTTNECNQDDANTNKKSASYTDDEKQFLMDHFAKIMTSCIILRIEDFTVNRVTTNNKQTPKEFIKGDRDRPNSPPGYTLHAEFTHYYYPGDREFPLPPPKFYVQVNPVVMNFDGHTVLWLNAFALNLYQSLLNSKQKNNETPNSNSNSNYVDVKIEAIMPRLVFEGNTEPHCGQRDRPKSLQFQVSRALISNVRSSDGCSRADLAKCLNACQLGSLFYGTEFPVAPGDYNVIPDKFSDHVQCNDNVRPPIYELPNSVLELPALDKTLFWTEARDVWCIDIEPLWGEFFGARGVACNRPVPFLDAFPLKIWVHFETPTASPSNNVRKPPEIHALAYISNLVSLQLNHYQLLFLLRLADEITEVLTVLDIDSQRITRGATGIVVVGAVIPQVELTLVMPSPTPGKESSGGDLESVIPDTSSLYDDVVLPNSNSRPSTTFANMFPGGKLESPASLTERIPHPLYSEPELKVKEERVMFRSDVAFSSREVDPFLAKFKKGFSNVTNILPKMLDDSFDMGSIRSDDSPSSDNIDKMSICGDAMFDFGEDEELNDDLEFGCEAVDDLDVQSGATLSVTTPSENPSNTSNYKRRDLISVATFKLGQVEVCQQSEGVRSSIKANVSNIALEECAAIPWDEFQNKFNSRSRGWTEVCGHPAIKPRIKMRLEHLVKAGESKTWPGPRDSSWFEDMLIMALSNIGISINMPTLSSIVEFFVDDVPTPPLPMQISMENMELNLIEERSAAGAAPPMNVKISQLHVNRNAEGIISVEPPSVPKGPSSTSSSEVTEMKAELEQLLRRLAAMERLSEENHRLRKYEEEAQELRSCLNDAQDFVNTLLQEKQGLIDMIKAMQVSKNEGKQQSSSKR